MTSTTFFRTTVLTVVTVLFLSCSLAQALNLTSSQQAYIDEWLGRNGLNRYGDPLGTEYMGGSPLFDETSGGTMDRYEYVIKRHPRLLDEIQGLGGKDAFAALRELELEYEIAVKDLHLELAKPAQDKARIEALRRTVAQLQRRIDTLEAQLATGPARSFAPAVFGDDVQAALDSNDYVRVGELVNGLAEQGPGALKHEAGVLFQLNQQLRFRHQNAGSADEAQAIEFALGHLEPVLATLRV